MKVAGRSSEQNLLMPSGKRSLRNSPRDHQRNFLSGSVRGPARRLVMLRPQRVRRMVVRKHQQRRIMMKKKKKRKKKSKHCSLKTSDLLIKCADAHEFCSTFLSDLILPRQIAVTKLILIFGIEAMTCMEITSFNNRKRKLAFVTSIDFGKFISIVSSIIEFSVLACVKINKL